MYSYLSSDKIKEKIQSKKIKDIFNNQSDYLFYYISNYYFFNETFHYSLISSNNEDIYDIMIEVCLEKRPRNVVIV